MHRRQSKVRRSRTPRSFNRFFIASHIVYIAVGNLDFTLQPIGTLISAGRLRVPRNQRDYFWEVEHAMDLCTDFAEAIRSNKASYFLGTIVLTASTDQVFEVVDGQQRLATTTIIIATIRDIFHRRGEPSMVASTETDFLFRLDRDTEAHLPKLSLNVKDQEVFLSTILLNPKDPGRDKTKATGAPSNRKLAEAASAIRQYFEEVIKPIPESSKKDELKRWLNFLERGAHVIVLKVPDTGNAYTMFETLNDRGLKVSQADLVKNYLFGRAGTRFDEVEDKWTSMVAVLESIGHEDAAIDYLRYVCSLKFGLTRNVFDRIKEHVGSQQRAVEFAQVLEQLAHDYEAMLRADHPKWNSYPPLIRRSIRTLNLFDVSQIRHLMLAVAHHFSPIETARAFNLFVNWIVRLFIAGAGRIGRVESIYAKTAHAIHTAGKITTADHLSLEMKPYLATDEEFKQMFSTAKVGQAKLARYYLDALQRKQDNDDEKPELVPNDDTSQVNLEHVIPLSVTKEHWGSLDRDVAEGLYSRLGNMALLNARKNSKIGAVGFKQKKETFRATPFSLTNIIAQNASWGPEEVAARQQTMAKIAVKTWPLRVR